MIQTLIQYKSFIRDFVMLSGGRALTAVAGIIALPFLTRFYSPEAFGILGLVLAYTNILQVILSLRYEMAIVRADTEEGANTLCLLTIGISLVVAFLFYFGLFGFNSLFGFVSPSWLVSLIILAPLLNTLAKVFEARLERHQSYGTNALINMTAPLTAIVAQILLRESYFGLLWGYLVGECLRMILAGCFSVPLFRGYNFSKSKELLARFKKFPLFSIPASFANSLSSELPIFILEATLGAASVGLFTVLRRATLMPVSLIATTLNRIVYQRLSKKITRKQTVSREMGLAAGGAAAVSIVIGVVILVVSLNDGFAFILGKKWTVLDRDIPYLVPGMCMQLVATSVARFALFDRQEVGLVYQSLRVIVIGLAVGMSAFGGFGFTTIIISLGAAMFVLAAVQVMISFQLAKQYESGLATS